VEAIGLNKRGLTRTSSKIIPPGALRLLCTPTDQEPRQQIAPCCLIMLKSVKSNCYYYINIPPYNNLLAKWKDANNELLFLVLFLYHYPFGAL
jgi:hypothetical protein